MRRAIVTVALAGLALAAVARDVPPPPSDGGPAVANAFTVGTLYTFAVMRNGSGFCLPPQDEGVDIIWKKVEDSTDLFKDVKFEPNRLPEDAFLKLLREWFPCSLVLNKGGEASSETSSSVVDMKACQDFDQHIDPGAC
jgi:hypothetical protein